MTVFNLFKRPMAGLIRRGKPSTGDVHEVALQVRELMEDLGTAEKQEVICLCVLEGKRDLISLKPEQESIRQEQKTAHLLALKEAQDAQLRRLIDANMERSKISIAELESDLKRANSRTDAEKHLRGKLEKELAESENDLAAAQKKLQIMAGAEWKDFEDFLDAIVPNIEAFQSSCLEAVQKAKKAPSFTKLKANLTELEKQIEAEVKNSPFTLKSEKTKDVDDDDNRKKVTKVLGTYQIPNDATSGTTDTPKVTA